MKDNKGFTLVELIVCLAIFGIVAAAAFGFMLSGAKSFSTVGGRIDAQTHSQITMNFINEYLIDCDEAIYYNADTCTLCIINKPVNPADKLYSAYIFRYSGRNLSFSQGTAEKSGGSYICRIGEQDLLSDKTESFSVYLKNGGTDSLTVLSAEVDISFANQGSSAVECSKTVALRNKPVYADVSFAG
ncbi:MAG: prepilin-type N-terminal cleavage/methylation domain-containing protein [Clostridiales bacterium]|nr:prepilin-type N-terminal cleavage/methylation domain-containing protein [Clostridiales bacterium]